MGHRVILMSLPGASFLVSNCGGPIHREGGVTPVLGYLFMVLLHTLQLLKL